MKRIVLLLTAISLFGCRHSTNRKNGEKPVREYSVQSVLWQQRSAEYRALCHQAYNIARLRLKKLIDKNGDSGKPLAIVTDIDETVLDNSPFNAKLIGLDEEYSKERWSEWVNKKEAGPVPGAVKFYDYVESRGVEVFYISNRYVELKSPTIDNLKRLGFPNVTAGHVLLKDSTSNKQARRDLALKNHRVMMYLGDNLGDFSNAFNGSSRSAKVDRLKDKFGLEYIVFPNPMYGRWETDGIYGGRYDWSASQKDSIRKAKLKAY